MLGSGFDIPTLACRSRSASWSPAALSPQAWYDPSDPGTLFQDASMTQPVTTDGDPVGALRDKSGNGYDLTQSVTSRRPLYRTDGQRHWLEYDGSDDTLAGAQLPFPGGQTVGAGFELHSYSVNFPRVLCNNTEAADGTKRQPQIYFGYNSPTSIQARWSNINTIVYLTENVTDAGPLSAITATDGTTANLWSTGDATTNGGVNLSSATGGECSLGYPGFHGKIFGAVFCPGVLSADNRALLDTYLRGLGGACDTPGHLSAGRVSISGDA